MNHTRIPKVSLCQTNSPRLTATLRSRLTARMMPVIRWVAASNFGTAMSLRSSKRKKQYWNNDMRPMETNGNQWKPMETNGNKIETNGVFSHFLQPVQQQGLLGWENFGLPKMAFASICFLKRNLNWMPFRTKTVLAPMSEYVWMVNPINHRLNESYHVV